MHSSTQPFSLLGLFSFSGRETTDSYTISASPSIGLLGQGLRAIYSSFDDRTKSNLDLDGKSPLLSDYEKNYQKEDLDSISRAQSSISERASLYKQQLTGELPIGHGCSLTQTVFNGNLC
jgi:vesicular inhibitory amino acid transporter